MKTTRISRMRGASLLALSLAPSLAMSHAARAQDAPATEPAAQEKPVEKVVPDKDIIVTGSRIQRVGYNAPTPVTAVTAEELTRKAPSNVPDALNQLPQFQGSVNQNQQADTGASKVRSGNYLDIRALGSQRVLILLDGRRVPPTSSNGATDANLIPQMLIRRVDVVTGGASAVYGSDAVSGVVNFVLDEGFSGVKLNAQSGISTYGDDASYKFGLAYGHSFADNRLHLLLSAEMYNSNGITDRSSRYNANGQNTMSGLTIGGSGTAAAPYYYVSNAHLNSTTTGGLITSGIFAGQQFGPGGSLSAFNPGTAIAGRPGYGIGGDGLIYPSVNRTGAPSLKTAQIFGRLTYDITDDTSFFLDTSYNSGYNKDYNSSPASPGSGTAIYAENAFLPAAMSAAMAPGTSFTMNRTFADWPTDPTVQRSGNLIINTGLKGRLSTKFKWSAYYTHGFTRFDTYSYQLNNLKYFAAVDAVRNAAGNIVCRITVTNPGLMDNCVPLNIFGPGSSSQAAIDFVHGTSHWRTVNKMDLVSGNISGEPFSLWAGPVSLALGAEYRHQSLVQSSNADPAVPVNTTGLRGVTTPLTNTFAGVNVGTGQGAYTVKELYGEIALPLAKGSAIGDLDVNGAARYTNYSTSGSVTTWKVGASYKPISDLRFRGTLSQDIRAPSLFELFAGTQQTTSPLTDLHTGVSSNVNVVSSGNAQLKPEVARTLTIGTVINPRFLPRFTMSVDYYDIRIRDAIAQPFTYIQMADLCERSNGTSSLCAQIIRPNGFSDRSAANYPTQIILQNLNLARTHTQGLDIEATWRQPLKNGTLGVRLVANRLIHYKQQNSSLTPEYDFAGNADFIQGFYPLPLPKWRANMDVSYTNDVFAISVQERFVGGFHISDQYAYVNNDLPAVFYTDFNISHKINAPGHPEFFAVVNNVFNKKGPLFLISPVTGLNMPTARSTYDIVGRYFTLGLRARF